MLSNADLGHNALFLRSSGGGKPDQDRQCPRAHAFLSSSASFLSNRPLWMLIRASSGNAKSSR
ncbi:hypothetical protein LMIY3S_01647 [Labrys miyagiensis]